MKRMTRTGAITLLILGWFAPVEVLAAGSLSGPLTANQDASLIRAKAPHVLSAGARAFLHERDPIRASVWLFFTDKGITDATGFSLAAQAITLTDRARARRERTGTERIILADLPVYQSYVETVVALGAAHRRSSRWLNAASFDLPFDIIDDLSQLPFVAEIRPIARFGKQLPLGESDRPDRPAQAQSEEDFDYGLSQTQIFQINVQAAHAQGYTGKGVTLAVMDTGFRKSHDAFASHYADGRVLAEYDFVMNDNNTAYEEGDAFGQTSHGTMTWSTAGGYAPGHVIGPAYGANFILCKTEDLDSETPVEEDNWVAALEFADSIGVDVTSTSLAYSDWYTFEDYDGLTAVITLATNMCDSLGIVAVTAMGNNGPNPATILAPADAFNILAVGAVDATGTITGFSSRGPTFDRRVKPEVCAMGLDVRTASDGSDNAYRYGSGTSFSTPLVAGAAAVLIEARPELTPMLIREALKTTASRADQIDYTYGWGIINLGRALTWPVEFTADRTAGEAPLEINFANESVLAAQSLTWEFGDGAVSHEPTTSHVYDTPGLYDLTLTIQTELGPFTRTIPEFVAVHADTLRVENVEGVSWKSNRVDVYARNFLPLKEIEIPISWAGALDISLDSFSTAGLRTEYFSTQSMISLDAANQRATMFLRAAGSAFEPALEPGAGPVISLYFYLPFQPGPGLNPVALVDYHVFEPSFVSGSYGYRPAIESGSLRLGCCFGRVGDIDGDGGDEPTLADVSLLIDYLFIDRPGLSCYPEADLNQSGGVGARESDISIGDLALLIDRMFISGDALVLPECL